ncbi:hypothetical protein M8C21_020231, partial [Ambrosia artemisiifolia]
MCTAHCHLSIKTTPSLSVKPTEERETEFVLEPATTNLTLASVSDLDEMAVAKLLLVMIEGLERVWLGPCLRRLSTFELERVYAEAMVPLLFRDVLLSLLMILRAAQLACTPPHSSAERDGGLWRCADQEDGAGCGTVSDVQPSLIDVSSAQWVGK